MGENDGALIIIGLIGIGYLINKGGRALESAEKWVQTEYVEPFKRLKAGTSVHYSPYTLRYFSPTHSLKGSIWSRLFG